MAIDLPALEQSFVDRFIQIVFDLVIIQFDDDFGGCGLTRVHNIKATKLHWYSPKTVGL